MARNPALHTLSRDPSPEIERIVAEQPFDALAAPTNDDLITPAMALWPQGPAWGSPDGQAVPLSSTLAKFTRVLIDPFVFLYARAFSLTREATAGGTSELLDDWEADYGLPERCFVGDLTTAQRVTALVRKVRAEPVNTPGDFIRLALDYGFEIEIEEPCMFECGFSECGGKHDLGDVMEEIYWIVRVRGAGITYFECGFSECGYDPLFSLGAAEEILCLLRQMAPAWTIPVLEAWIDYAALSDGAGNVLSDGYGHPILFPISI